MKRALLFAILSLAVAGAQATEVLWMPMGTPQVTPVASTTPSPRETPSGPSKAAKNGYYLFTYTDGSVESEGNYVDGQKDGVWKYYRPDGSEIREMEFKSGAPTGSVMLTSPDGDQKYFKNFIALASKDLPNGFEVKTVIPFLLDLTGDGKLEVLSIVRAAEGNGALIVVMDENGVDLDARTTDGLTDGFVFGTVKKGGPVCFGYNPSCTDATGTCEWEFDIFKDGHIVPVLEYNGWYGKAGPYTLPVFKDVDKDGLNEIVTDNGTFKWNTAKGDFERK